ncbi:hypothetical protein CBR_g31514 [Chara braunii]|uniref:Serine racemase n=1 Tax=Chara braunii TaxID=69332 RepID=A0A388LFC3_CHABU|nr:hypothetical protein CBR_g31514 [Chara braunii]|eukprot:GBG80957.1 hypothetical protein CBR_g31514 [Chara braunii]
MESLSAIAAGTYSLNDDSQDHINDTDNANRHSQTGHELYAASLESILAAAKRIGPLIHRTAVLTSSSIAELSGNRTFFFKCEMFQKGGSFKFRGACNAVYSISDDCIAKGVVTHSSGNHAAALALAARVRGMPAYIVIPKNTPICKLEAVKRYGGVVHLCEPSLISRERTAEAIVSQTGATFIPPYNHGAVISGQGTVALELLDQVPDLDAIVAPISGGGLLSGIVLAAKGINPQIHVIAAEPKGADDVARSKAAGQLLKCENPCTIADGLRASMGEYTWPIVRDLVDGVITVDEEEIVSAMKICYQQLKVVAEPSGAVSLAAVLSPQFTAPSSAWAGAKRVGVVLSGGNVDLEVLWKSFIPPH